MLKLVLWPFKIVYYMLYPFIWFYKRYFGYANTQSDGIAFEYVCADILRRRGFINVKVTQASGDQGIDVLASKGGKRYAVQCKLYSNPVSNSAVQEAFAGMKYYGCSKAAVMTNSTFTESARDLAESIGVELWDNTPTSAKRFRNPLVFWGSLIIWLIYSIYLEETLSVPEEVINDKQGNAAIVWVCFILIYVFVYPLVSNIGKGIIASFGNLSRGVKSVSSEMRTKKANKAGIEISVDYDFEIEPSVNDNQNDFDWRDER